MAFKYNPFTGELDYWLESLTGAEIVALLEALSGNDRLSHDSLSDVSTSDHHARYADAEAATAAKTVKLDDFAAPDDNTDLDAAAAQHGLMPKADKSKIDAIEAGATADLTGAEIVVLLEALAAESRLSHTKLDDIGASDHHAKYTDAEARAAAFATAAVLGTL